MQKYIYKDGRILQDVTQEIRMQYPKIAITEAIYNDVTEEYTDKINQAYLKVEPKMKKKSEFVALVQSYNLEIAKLTQEIEQIVTYCGIDKDLVKSIDIQKAAAMGF